MKKLMATLLAATSLAAAAAAFPGLDKGTIEVGRVADLVLLDGNPLDDIANSRRVHGVMIQGQWVRVVERLDALR